MTTKHKSAVNLGPLDTFPVDEFRIFDVDGRSVGILRRSDGRIHAMRNWCPHKGAEICKTRPTGTFEPGAPGTLAWGRDGEIVRCPWHGFEFEIETGARPYSDSRMRLRIYPARVEGGDVIIDMGPR